jgi:hypothetical protein
MPKRAVKRAMRVPVGDTVTAPVAAPKLREGEWGTGYRMEVVGMPSLMAPITVKQDGTARFSAVRPGPRACGIACRSRRR